MCTTIEPRNIQEKTTPTESKQNDDTAQRLHRHAVTTETG